jgi:CHAT domain-containing protein
MGAPTFAIAAEPDKVTAQEVTATMAAATRSVARSYASRGKQWAELPGAEREIAAVADLFAPADRVVATRAAASESRLHALNRSGALAGFRYLLFATHGYLDTDAPARSALVLSQVDDDPRFDGYLTAAKWPAYRLASDLAVLSACETGLGRQLQGEGIMGLPYALFVAGNRSTVLTLWRIDDSATTTFVAQMFRRVRDGATPSAALAATKRAFATRAGGQRAAAIWAPFVLYGD